MLEVLLAVSLGVNGWLFNSKGKVEQEKAQVAQELIEKNDLVDRYYNENAEINAAFAEAKSKLQSLMAVSSSQRLELEKLKLTNTSVRYYMSTAIPHELIVHHKHSYEDRIRGKDNTPVDASDGRTP